MAALPVLTSLGLVLLLGVICVFISNKMRVPSMLLLLASGILIGYLELDGRQILNLPQEFYASLGIVAAILILFEGAANYDFRKMDSVSSLSLNLIMVFLLINAVFMTIAIHLIGGVDLRAAVLFAIIMVGTSQDIVKSLFNDMSTKLMHILRWESSLNTALVILLSFIMLDFVETVNLPIMLFQVVNQLVEFAQLIIVGLGAGVLVGLVVFRAMRQLYSKQLSPIALVSASLLTFALAEHLGGDGIVAVSTLALVFGNIAIKKRQHLDEFIVSFGSFFHVLIFVLLGVLIRVPWNSQFAITSITLYVIFLLVRYVSLALVFKGDFNYKQYLFMALNIPKGVATAVILFILATLGNPMIEPVLFFGFAFILYSLLASALVHLFPHKFIA